MDINDKKSLWRGIGTAIAVGFALSGITLYLSTQALLFPMLLYGLAITILASVSQWTHIGRYQNWK